ARARGARKCKARVASAHLRGRASGDALLELQGQEARRPRRDGERARRQTFARFQVELPRGDVVRSVRVEERSEQLDLSSSRSELPLTSAVPADPALLAVVVRGEEPFDRSEPGGLHVHRPRGPGKLLDVLDRVDDRVPGDPIAVRLQHRLGLGGEGRILEPGVCEAFRNELVEGRVRRRVDDGAPVLAFQVDRVDRPGRGKLGHEVRRRGRARVELEAKRGIQVEPGADAVRRRRVAEAHRHDERDRMWLGGDGLTERAPALPQSEIERCALERPAAVVDVAWLRGLLAEERLSREMLREGMRGPRAGQWEIAAASLHAVVLGSVVRDVLSDSLLARPVQVDDGGLAEEVAPRLELQAFAFVAIDAEREIPDCVVQSLERYPGSARSALATWE